MDIILFIISLVLVIIGANALTEGAASIANRLNISSLIIGLTIVGIGTSAPELAVTISAALKGCSDIALGSIIGCNIFNSLFIIGCTAIIAPIAITHNTLRQKIPFCILASIILFICSNDILINKAHINVINASEGLMLLCFFCIFISYFFITGKNDNSSNKENIITFSWIKSIIYIISGILFLIIGSKFIVEEAISIARTLNISEAVISTTIIAIGCSIPELATSIVAALKKNPEMAIGNIIGSNLFNIFFVLGCSATITPLHPIGITNFYFIWLIASSILLWIFSIFGGKQIIMRSEGTILVFVWFLYTVWSIIR